MTALALALALAAPPGPAAYREALELLYDGRPEAAQARTAELARAAPDDPMPLYLEALVLCWRLEQQPETTALDKELERTVAQGLALAERRLGEDPSDLDVLLARGAIWGVSSRFHLFRRHQGDAARTAARMRQDLSVVRQRDPSSRDALFGLGLYDYYADVLPRLFKVLRFLARIPGGNRERGLAMIEKTGEQEGLHWTEAHNQLYEIYAFYEKTPDRALLEIRELSRRYPGWPLWGLRLAEHLRDRMGLYAESVEAARAVAQAEERRHPQAKGGAAAALARLSWGESLLRDLRLPEARRAMLPLLSGTVGTPAMAARAHLLAGRSLELEGDRQAATGEYRQAAATGDRDTRRQARDALGTPVEAAEVRARRGLAEARRLRERGRHREATLAYRGVLKERPETLEAALAVAEDELMDGDAEAARQHLVAASGEDVDPAWLRPWRWLIEARLQDADGHRSAAVRLYHKVFEEPYGRAELREAASAGLRQPFLPPSPGSEGHPSPRSLSNNTK